MPLRPNNKKAEEVEISTPLRFLKEMKEQSKALLQKLERQADTGKPEQ